MSDIASSNLKIKTQILDGRFISEVINLGDDNVVMADHITQIPQAALQGKDQNNVASVKAIKIGDQASDALAKWTEDHNIDIDKSIAWMKLNGASSPGVPRPIVVIGGNLINSGKFDESGAFIPGSPSQTSDSGDASKILLSGIGTTPVTFFTNLQAEPPAIPQATMALWPACARQIYVDKNGTISIFIAVRLNGASTHRPILLYSKDGGINFTTIDVDNTFSGMCFSTSFIVDKNENYNLVWVQSSDADAAHRYVAYRKYSKDFVALTNVIKISKNDYNYTYDANIQLKNDGETVAIIWSAGGYSANPYNLAYREVTSSGSLSGITNITTNAVRYTKDYRSPSIGFDSSGYRHILFQSQNTSASPAYANVHYIRETVAGLQPMIQINNDDANDGWDTSNIIVDENNTAWIAYIIDKDGTECKLYIKTVISGVVGSRILVENGGGSEVGADSPQIQQLPNKNIIAIYKTITTPHEILSREISQSLTVGTKNILYTQESGYDNVYPHMPYGIHPNINNIRPSVPQQGTLVLFLKSTLPGYAPSDLQLVGTQNLIMGSSTRPIRINTRTINIRGVINKTKFNNMANTAIS